MRRLDSACRQEQDLTTRVGRLVDAVGNFFIDQCQHVTRKSMAASALKNQRRAKQQITNCSNTCLWNVLNCLNGYTNQISEPKWQTNSRLSQNSHLVAVQNKTSGKILRQPSQPPHCYGKNRGVHSILRSGVEQRSFAHTVWPPGTLLLLHGDVERKHRAHRRRTHNERSHTGLDCGVLRIRRSRLGAASLGLI